MAPTGLLGPPSVHASAHPGGLLGPPSVHAAPAAPTGDPFLDLMDAGFNSKPPPMTLTENGSATFASSGDPCLDFFFQVVPDTDAKTVKKLLRSAWAKDPLTALKLVCHLRAVRGTGKSDRKGFYAAAFWLHANHPKTLALNAVAVADFGYLKDLPEILHRLVAPGSRKRTLKESEAKAGGGIRRRSSVGRVNFRDKPKQVSCKTCRCKICRCKKNFRGFRRGGVYSGWGDSESDSDTEMSSESEEIGSDWEVIGPEDVGRKKQKRGGEEKKKPKVVDVEKLAAEMAKVKIRMEEAASKRHDKRATMAATAVERYATDPHYRLLHDCTSDMFAALLSSDLQLLKSGDMKHFSLAAKWCPSLNSSYDRSTLLCESIARRIFPRESDPEYLTIQEQHYAYRVRDRLRKEVLVPLRKALKLPEVYICAGQWGSIPYSRVASVAMKNYKDLFMSKDEERFTEYLGRVKEGKAKIAAGALLPHQILASALKGRHDEVAELQWRRMVSDLSERGKLSNCIAVCDVSGSMRGTPMDVCVALGMLISELSEEPWKGRVITFSESPQLHLIKGGSLKEKAEFVQTMEWGMNTDFQKVFDQILRVEVEGKLEAEKMIKKVFVFSDMEFDQASGKDAYSMYGYGYPNGGNHNTNSWETDYEVICRKFEESGYGSAVPEIVFWNLRDSRSTPVTSDQKGVALVSGFSKNLVKLFLKGEDIPSPKAVMEAAIAGEEYQKLAVYD